MRSAPDAKLDRAGEDHQPRGMRTAGERTARGIAIGIIAWALWSAVWRGDDDERVDAKANGLARRLTFVTREGSVRGLRLAMDSTLDLQSLAWLAALRRAGVSVSWDGPLPATAVAVTSLADPQGGALISLAAPAGDSVVLSDDTGIIGTARVGRVGATVGAPFVNGPVRAVDGAFSATARQADSLVLRPILVSGAAGWEAKFVVAALEEWGWAVAARLSVAPHTDVRQGAMLPVDTGSYAAVILLDSAARVSARALLRFVRQGGGAVLAGTSPRDPSLLALVVASIGPRRPGSPSLVADSVGLRTLGFYPLVDLRGGSVPLMRRGGSTTIAARRVGAGRVLQIGFDESWRWRMEGGADAPEAHRLWWSRVVASVATAPVEVRDPRTGGLGAPLAQTIDALGVSTTAAPRPVVLRPFGSRVILTTVLVLLLTEWGSRRLRGAR